jgi:cellulose synthase/poly-beta-1,6-N-acetylglucosamine synthase-like glycosyltransferase
MMQHLPLLLLAFSFVLMLLTANTLYFLVFSVGGSFFKKSPQNSTFSQKNLKILVLYPAYKEDEVILDAINSFQRQVYPKDCFKTVVIADELQEDTLFQIKLMGASIFRLPHFEKRNKARAINALLKHMDDDFDVCIVMDADNTVEKDFLRRMNSYFINGAQVVQAKRVAKNNSNNLSQLDNYSEIINNHIFRKGQCALGFSSSLIGSGMGFNFRLFKEVMQGMDVFSGFDKELELRLLERRIKMEYAEEIRVYDEKVASHDVFVNQRRRWLYAQIHFLKTNYYKAIYQLFAKGNFDFANKVIQFALLPRIISIGMAAIVLAITPFISWKLFAIASVNALLLGTALVLPLQSHVSIKQLIAPVIEIPRVFSNMLIAGITSGRASKKFLHTPHHTK